MAEVDILLAAYNGEKFIAEQIDSILAQTFQGFLLIIRDDGSSDNTPAIIADYAAKYPGKIEVVHDDVVCRHPTKNFFQLLTYAKADYVMFSDQDDVWLPEKIQITLDAMKKAEHDNPGKPVLVFTGLHVVDAKLNPTNRFMAVNVPAYRYDFKNVLYLNIATGATQMINRELYENIGGYYEGISLHDWWVTLYASAMGVVMHVPKAAMLYRQHDKNVIGASSHGLMGRKGYLARLFRIISHPTQTRKKFYLHGKEIQLFRTRYLNVLPPDKIKQTDELLELFDSNRLKRIKAIIKRRGFKDITELTFVSKIKCVIFHLMF